jgi:hypothetical protein
MLDTSGSMTANIDLPAAQEFLLRCCRRTRGVGAFNDKIQMSARFTNNRDQPPPK